MLKINKNKIGPKIFPWFANDRPTPVAMIRNVPQMNESPIPAKGPINETFTLLILSVSKSGSFALLSSIAALIPRINVDN